MYEQLEICNTAGTPWMELVPKQTLCGLENVAGLSRFPTLSSAVQSYGHLKFYSGKVSKSPCVLERRFTNVWGTTGSYRPCVVAVAGRYSKDRANTFCSKAGGIKGPNVSIMRVGLANIDRKCSNLLARSGPSGEPTADLELAIFTFMKQSSKPHTFPSKDDFVSAGRIDLVEAIAAEGGWLAAGWEGVETTPYLSGRDKSGSRQRSSKMFNSRSSGRSSEGRQSFMTTVMIDKPTPETTQRMNGKDIIGKIVQPVNVKSRRKRSRRTSNLRMRFGTDAEVLKLSATLGSAQSPKKGVSSAHDRHVSVQDDCGSFAENASLLSILDESKPKLWQGGQEGCSSRNTSIRNDGLSNGMVKEVTKTLMTNMMLTGESSPIGTTVETLEAKSRSSRIQTDGILDTVVIHGGDERKERETYVEINSIDGEVDGTLDWIRQVVDERENWIVEARSKSSAKSTESTATSLVVDARCIQNCIRTLEANLIDTRAALQSGRESLWQSGKAQEFLSEVVDTEHAVEFCENSIIHARSELSTTRAQVAALKGCLEVEIMEARQTLEESCKKLEKARTVLKSLRFARIVWPNPATEVFLTGSFDGWNNQIKMQRSSAGVFVVSLPLHPGCYEIKFVVDGSWRVDTGRPIIYGGGYENNVLMVS